MCFPQAPKAVKKLRVPETDVDIVVEVQATDLDVVISDTTVTTCDTTPVSFFSKSLFDVLLG